MGEQIGNITMMLQERHGNSTVCLRACSCYQIWYKRSALLFSCNAESVFKTYFLYENEPNYIFLYHNICLEMNLIAFFADKTLSNTSDIENYIW